MIQELHFFKFNFELTPLILKSLKKFRTIVMSSKDILVLNKQINLNLIKIHNGNPKFRKKELEELILALAVPYMQELVILQAALDINSNFIASNFLN